jgi:hypothetical protein
MTMMTREQLCTKIEAIYPEIGACGIDVDVEWDEVKRAWVVDLKRGDRELITHLEDQDAEACMQGRQCVALGLQIAQLKSNIERMTA